MLDVDTLALRSSSYASVARSTTVARRLRQVARFARHLTSLTTTLGSSSNSGLLLLLLLLKDFLRRRSSSDEMIGRRRTDEALLFGDGDNGGLARCESNGVGLCLLMEMFEVLLL